MSGAELVDIITVGNVLGEGIQWNAADGCAWWTDIQACRLYRWRSADACLQSFSVPERAGSFAFVEDHDELLIVAFQSGIARHCLDTGRTGWIGRPEAGRTGRRFNDGRADRQGRFWAGTMVEHSRHAASDSASLYCVDSSGALSRHLGGIQISNGLCFSPDSRYCYFADTPRRAIFRYDFDADSGRLGARRLFAETPAGSFPDGATVDSDGCMWSAHWGSGRVIRYAPDGRVDQTLTIPVRQPSCVAFGGRNLDLLFVTSARDGLSRAALAEEPQAGDVFVFRTQNTGLVEPRYRRNEPENACASQSSTT